jgi:hypothetical protein
MAKKQGQQDNGLQNTTQKTNWHKLDKAVTLSFVIVL